MVTVPYASIVNLIADEIIVPEFIQSEMTSENLTNAMIPLLNKTSERKKMLLGYEKVRRTLGLPGVYDRAAEAIINRL
jgi:lipid-A-disaccharide synthase